jgi:hypothetical protein
MPLLFSFYSNIYLSRYHKQFFHGISSVSGRQFMEPIDQRWGDQDAIEGLCHQCRNWISICTAKRKNSVLWYRHAHKVRYSQITSNVYQNICAIPTSLFTTFSSSSVISTINQKPHSPRDALLYSFNCLFQFCENLLLPFSLDLNSLCINISACLTSCLKFFHSFQSIVPQRSIFFLVLSSLAINTLQLNLPMMNVKVFIG